MGELPKINHGLMNVEIGPSAICEIDGQKGRLSYRGIPIEDLVDLPFEDVAFLIIKGHLPTTRENDGFRQELAETRELPDGVRSLLNTCRHLKPYAALQVGLSVFRTEIDDTENAAAWISATASIIAYHHAVRQGESPVPPDPRLDHASDFLRRVGGDWSSEDAARAMNVDFILHAEHGACASTLGVRVAVEAGASLSSALQVGLSCLSGERHGDAVTRVGQLIGSLKSSAAAVEYIDTALRNKEAPSGFGHRVYKTRDPRARIYRTVTETLIGKNPVRPVAVDVVDTLIKKMEPMGRFGIAPNDDIEAGLLYSILGLPTDLNLPIFAAARVCGWIAHYQEASCQDGMGVPKLRYKGPSGATTTDDSL